MLQLRDTSSRDAALIVAFIKELAEFEELAHECEVSVEMIEKWLFGPNPKAYCTIAEWDGKPAAFALYFYNFSTFLGKPGIYLEDLFVRPEFRRKGIAKSLFKYLIAKVVAEGCGRLEWWVLDWNVDAISFYQSLGAKSMEEWTVQRIEGAALNQFIEGEALTMLAAE